MKFAISGLLVSVLNASLTCCMCGHLDKISLPGSSTGFGLALIGFLFGKNPHPTRRITICICLILATLILLKNIGDILWWGHHPVYG